MEGFLLIVELSTIDLVFLLLFIGLSIDFVEEFIGDGIFKEMSLVGLSKEIDVSPMCGIFDFLVGDLFDDDEAASAFFCASNKFLSNWVVAEKFLSTPPSFNFISNGVTDADVATVELKVDRDNIVELVELVLTLTLSLLIDFDIPCAIE
ncbi:unnamed protein product [[Candida] boidinii]|uniref:Unnamed protein product n=1 Tax=Candida boidinii TaxID=5477 RepID=A0A9W6T9X6_CANBO|nr:unnamed protein product [[Candida] boidinii]